MVIEEMVTDEFFNYRNGFINGKDRIINDIMTNNFSNIFLEEINWYSIGFMDGFNYYYDYYVEHGYVPNNLIKSSVCNEIAREFFIERLIEYNEIYIDNLPALRLKVKM